MMRVCSARRLAVAIELAELQHELERVVPDLKIVGVAALELAAVRADFRFNAHMDSARANMRRAPTSAPRSVRSHPATVVPDRARVGARELTR